jgi:hypothetical protein
MLRLATEDGKLLTEGEVLGDENRPWSEGGALRPEDRNQEPEHAVIITEAIATVARESARVLG